MYNLHETLKYVGYPSTYICMTCLKIPFMIPLLEDQKKKKTLLELYDSFYTLLLQNIKWYTNTRNKTEASYLKEWVWNFLTHFPESLQNNFFGVCNQKKLSYLRCRLAYLNCNILSTCTRILFEKIIKEVILSSWIYFFNAFTNEIVKLVLNTSLLKWNEVKYYKWIYSNGHG